MNLLKALQVVYAVVTFAILLAEELGDNIPGFQKKAEAIAKIKEIVISILGQWPVWLPDAVLSWLIDLLVDRFNKAGVFKRGQPLPPALE